MRWPQRFLRLLLVLFLSACSTATPNATPPPNLRVGLSQAAGDLRPALLACLPEQAADQISIESVLPGAIDLNDYALLIQLGEANSMPEFAAALGADSIVAVVNAANPLRQLSRDQLAAIFSGRVTDWADVGGSPGPLEVWIPLEGDEARSLFRASVLLGGEYRGDGHLAADASRMQAAIAADSGAIGLLPASLLTENLRGIETGIEAPILALAVAEPDAALLATLACLQAQEE
jgi:hypothetical protein